jgi:hypothetical protein
MPLRVPTQLAVLAIAGLSVLATSAPAGAATRVPARIRGSLTFSSRTDWVRHGTKGCRGRALYGDVGGGTSVTVSDLTGRVLGRSSLASGRRTAAGCRFAFVLRKLPAAPLYHLVVGPARNIVYQDLFSPTDPRLEDHGLDFTIGSPAPVE